MTNLREAAQMALEDLEKYKDAWRDDGRRFYIEETIEALRARLAQFEPEPVAWAEPEPVAWADYCRIELVAAVHSITSDYENALGAFDKDVEARRKAEGDIAHARKIAAKWNWNGRTAPPSGAAATQRVWQGLTDAEAKKVFEAEDCRISADLAGILARAIEAKLKEKNK